MFKENIVISLDLGSTNIKLILFSNLRKQILCKEIPFETYFPQKGWVEHQGDELWEVIEKNLIEFLDSLKKEDYPSCLSISTQRESVLLWSKEDGISLSQIISWQDNRTEEMINNLKDKERNLIREKTGLWITTYSSATKLNYLVKKIGNNLKEDYLMGTLESWLIYKLTKSKKFVSDYSSASRTALFNLHTLEWDSELCNFFEIPIKKLPQIINNDEEISEIEIGNHKLIIKGVVGDQQGALYFANRVNKINSSLVYGTGAFLLKLTPKELNFQDLLESFEGESSPLITIAWKKIHESPRFALEWSFSNCGQSLDLLKNNFQINNFEELGNFQIEKLNWTYYPFCLPFFSGKWLLSSRESWISSFHSINNQSKKEDWIISYFEGLAFSIRAMLEKSGIEEEKILVGGGLIQNNLFNSIQSNGLNRSLIISEWIQLSGIGAALFAIKEDILNCKIREVRVEQDNKELFNLRYKEWNKLLLQNKQIRSSN